MLIQVALEQDSYPIHIKRGLLKEARAIIENYANGQKIVIISDRNVYPLYGDDLVKTLSAANKSQKNTDSALGNDISTNHNCEVFRIILPAGEATKSIHTLPSLYAQLVALGITRSDLLIALGGGVIGDLVGFVAATYLRGISFIQIPTSLLAQVDSSVGGKVAVDLPEGKNLVGAFFHPKCVLIDPEVLTTLTPRFFADGMAEVIKYGCIFDAALFDLLKACGRAAHNNRLEDRADASQSNECYHRLEIAKRLQEFFLAPEQSETLEEIIARCVDLKRRVVEADVYDKGERMLLNFGHTLGHALEQFHHYERESHGEAVAIGMVAITHIAEQQQLSEVGTAQAIQSVCELFGLPVHLDVAIEDLKQAMVADKKNLNKKLNLILLEEIGKSYIYPSDLAFFS